MKVEEIEEKYRERLMEAFVEMYAETEGMLTAVVMTEGEVRECPDGTVIIVELEFYYTSYEGELN